MADDEGGHSPIPEPEIILDTGNDVKGMFSEALARIEGPSSFAGGNVEATLPNPGLDIHDHGVVGLPLSPTDAQTIKAKCRKSAFGKGAQTIVDDSVRCSWELNPDQFTLRNPRWQHAIQALLPQVREQLNLPYGADHIQAELYKLLLYEEGAFFKAHQDSEKTPGMFGTLIVALPSPHQGGDLAMRHQRERFLFSTASNSSFGFSWASWYSDVFHEVRPVTSGTRLVLTYNLAIRRDGGAPVYVPPSLSSFEPRLKAILRAWDGEVDSGKLPKYLVHRLDHQYTEATLRTDVLRGKDRGQIEALKAIASQTDCALFLATMERVLHCDDECGSEIFDSELKLRVVTTLEGDKMSEHFALAKEHLMEEERKFQDRDPDEEEHEGYTGNEGSPATYWYRDTVLVIVPGKALLNFTVQGDHKFRIALQKLLEFKAHLTCESTSNVFNQLAALLLHKEKTSIWSWPSYRSKEETEARQNALKEVAYLALQQNRLEIFDQAVEMIDSTLPMKCFHELGRCLRDTIKARGSIEFAITKQHHIATKYAIYQNIVRGFDEALRLVQVPLETQIDVQARPEIDTTRAWLDQELIDIVMIQDIDVRKIDGQALAAICVKALCNEGDIYIARLWALLQFSHGAARVAFCRRLSQAVHGDEITTEEHTKFLERVLGYFWLSLKATEASAHVPDLVRSGPVTTTAEFSLTAGELTDMLRVTQLHLPKIGYSKHDVYCILIHTVKQAHPHEFVALHIPFAQLVMANKVEFAREDGNITPEAAHFVAHTILAYLRRYVGTEPVAPQDWSRRESMSGCSCRDCLAVNAFLASPDQIIGRFPMNKNRRAHLHRQFTDKAKTSSYSVETTRNSNPHTWQVTKNRSGYQSLLKAWKFRVADAKQNLKSMDGTEQLLKPILGNDYPAAMEANASAFTSPANQRHTHVLKESDRNLKRSAPDGSADGSNKKAAIYKPTSGSTFIDLTED